MKLKQFIPREYCLQCTTCCRFTENPSEWAPQFTQEEISSAIENNILPPELFSQSKSELEKHKSVCSINLVGDGDAFRCPCFSPESNKCSIYAYRPFECQLYPFLLCRNDDQLFVIKDKNCPYITSGDGAIINAYTDYIRETFQKKEAISFLKKYRDLFYEYHAEDLDIVMAIPLD